MEEKLILEGDWVEAPHEGRIRRAKVLRVHDVSFKGDPNARIIASLQDVDDGTLFTASVESCVEVEGED